MQLEWIQEDSMSSTPSPPVATYTTENRTKWHHIRNKLIKTSTVNAESVKLVERLVNDGKYVCLFNYALIY